MLGNLHKKSKDYKLLMDFDKWQNVVILYICFVALICSCLLITLNNPNFCCKYVLLCFAYIMYRLIVFYLFLVGICCIFGAWRNKVSKTRLRRCIFGKKNSNFRA